MGSGKHEKEKNRLPPFVPLLIVTLNQPAWRAMSHGAQMLYVALKRRYSINFHNNGKIFLSQRMAAKELNSHHNQVARWFRELQHYGFIVLSQPGWLGVEGKGKAPRWRLTELGYMRDFPTRNYEKWDGTPFVDQKKSRARKTARSVAGNPHSDVPENRPTDRETVQSNAHRGDEDQCDGKHAQNYIAIPIAPQPAAPINQASERVRLQPRNRVRLEPINRPVNPGKHRRSDADAPPSGGAASMPAGPPGGRAHVEAPVARVPRRDRRRPIEPHD